MLAEVGEVVAISPVYRSSGALRDEVDVRTSSSRPLKAFLLPALMSRKLGLSRGRAAEGGDGVDSQAQAGPPHLGALVVRPLPGLPPTKGGDIPGVELRRLELRALGGHVRRPPSGPPARGHLLRPSPARLYGRAGPATPGRWRWSPPPSRPARSQPRGGRASKPRRWRPGVAPGPARRRGWWPPRPRAARRGAFGKPGASAPGRRTGQAGGARQGRPGESVAPPGSAPPSAASGRSRSRGRSPPPPGRPCAGPAGDRPYLRVGPPDHVYAVPGVAGLPAGPGWVASVTVT